MSEGEETDFNGTRRGKKKRIIDDDDEDEEKEEEKEDEISHSPQPTPELSDMMRASQSRSVSAATESEENKLSQKDNRDAGLSRPEPAVRYTTDRYNRKHVRVPTTGKTFLYIRPTKINSSTPLTHYLDLMDFMKDNYKPNVVASVDGGSDFTCRSLKTLYWHARFFFDAGLDSFTLVMNSANYSAFNFWIEHFWAWCSAHMIGVQLTGTLPGHGGVTPKEYHSVPVCTSECLNHKKLVRASVIIERQKKTQENKGMTSDKEIKRADTIAKNKMKILKVPCLPECVQNKAAAVADIQRDERAVFKAASEELAKYWHGKKYDTHDVKCTVVSDLPPEDLQQESDTLDKYILGVNKKKTLVGAEFYKMHQFWLLLLRHLAKKQTHQLSLQAHCGVVDCVHKNCHEKGSKMLWAMKENNMPFNATPCATLTARYKTYLQHKDDNGRNQAEPDMYILLGRRPNKPTRPVECPYKFVDGKECAASWVSSSKTEMERHYKIHHSDGARKLKLYNKWIKTAKIGEDGRVVSQAIKKRRTRRDVFCRYIIGPTVYCDARFAYWPGLHKHQKETGHHNQGRQSSRHPGSHHSDKTDVEKNKKRRKTRKDKADLNSRTNMTTSVNLEGKIGTDNQSVLQTLQEHDGMEQDPVDAMVSSEKEPEAKQHGADVIDCKPKNMAVVFAKYDFGGKGIELFEVVSVTCTTPGEEAFTGKKYGPRSNTKEQILSTDIKCLSAAWGATGESEECKCYTVEIYFVKLKSNGHMPKKVYRTLNRDDLFQNQSTERTVSPTRQEGTPSKDGNANSEDEYQDRKHGATEVEDQGQGRGVVQTESVLPIESPMVVEDKNEEKKQELLVVKVSGNLAKDGQGGRSSARQVGKSAVGDKNAENKQEIVKPHGNTAKDGEGGRSRARQGGKESVSFKVGGFVICWSNYLLGSRGVDMYKVASVNEKNDTLYGTQWVPSNDGIETCDPACLNGTWHSLRYKVNVEMWSVLVYFDKLNANGKIPQRTLEQISATSKNLFAPVQRIFIEIVKREQSPFTGQNRYLVLSRDNELTWMESNAPGLVVLLKEWNEGQLEESSSKQRAIASADSPSTQQVKIWVQENPYLLYGSDSQVINKGGPLSHVIVDAALTMLARTSRKFQMISCLCPIEGYNQVDLDKPHYQVHHCGKNHSHFVTSVYSAGVIWYIDYLQPDVIPPAALIQMVDLYSSREKLVSFRILCVSEQVGERICGVLSIAALVEMALCKDDAEAIARLSTNQFDESKACQWLINCLSSGVFSPCPSTSVSSTNSLNNADNQPPQYTEYTPTQEFLTNVCSVFTRATAVTKTKKGIVTGSGARAEAVANPSTSIGQEANRRLFVGCAVRLSGKEDALWVVSAISKRRHTVTLSAFDNGDVTLKAHEISSDVTFTVVGPPQLRCGEPSCVSEFELVDNGKILLLYPLSYGRLSNTVFHTASVNAYTVIEATACDTLFDAECLFRVLAGREVNVQMRIHDLLPVRSLCGRFRLRPDLPTTKELYQEVLTGMVTDHKVTLVQDPFALHYANAYPSGMTTTDLPVFPACREIMVYRPVSSSDQTARKMSCQVTLPDIGLEEVFAEKSVHEITQWIWKAYVDTHTNGVVVRSACVKAEAHTLVVEDDCLECVVKANKIIRDIPGSKLTKEDTDRLHKSCVQFVKSVRDYCHCPEAAGLEIGSWRILTHEIWGCYIVRMHLVKGDVKIADVRGIHAVYHAHLGIMSSAVSIGGLINFGGHKLALAGTHTTANKQKDVVLYKSRYDVCETAKTSFRNEVRMMKSLSSVPRVLQISHINEECGWALVERCPGSVHRLFASLGLAKRKETVMVLLRGCATALIAVHTARVIHRDVKPANFLCKQGNGKDERTYDVKIADFGLAVALPPNTDTTTGDVGTRSYKAPEIKHSVSYGTAVDVYAFGVMVWEMVYQQRRSSQLIEAVSEYGKQHPNSPYNSPTAYATEFCTPPLTGEYGKDIDEIISLCTSKSPRSRPGMKEVLKVLMTTEVLIPSLIPEHKKTTPGPEFSSVLSTPE